jgi:hypothetical protein
MTIVTGTLFGTVAAGIARLPRGNPGAYRQLGLIFAERPDYANNLNVTFVYTPATQGAKVTGPSRSERK